MATDINPVDLDNYITGHYGEDQYEECAGCEDEDNAPHTCDLAEDTRDFDSMPGGWDYEEPDDSWLDSYWETE